MKLTILVTSLAITGSWIDSRVIDVWPEKLVNGFGVGITSPSSMFILLRVSRKITLTVLPVLYDEIYGGWIAVRLIDPAGFVSQESYQVVLIISGRGHVGQFALDLAFRL